MVQQTFSGVPDDPVTGNVIPVTFGDKVREFILSLVADGTESTTGNVMPLLLDMGAGQQWEITAGGLLRNFQAAAAADDRLALRVSGDTNSRFVSESDGTMKWGPGNAALDTNLYRDAAGRLKTDDSFESAVQFLSADGAVGAPGFAFSSQPNTGLFRQAASVLGFAANGSTRMTVSGSVTALINNQRLQLANGTSGDPALYFASTSDGIYHDTASSQLRYVVDGNDEYVMGTTALAPATTAVNDLGTASLEWRDIYLVNSPTVSSDARTKSDIADEPLGLAFVQQLRSRRWARPQGDGAGFVAQEVRAALQAEGDPDFPGFVDAGDGGLKLRPMEFIGPLTNAIQELAARVEALEAG